MSRRGAGSGRSGRRPSAAPGRHRARHTRRAPGRGGAPAAGPRAAGRRDRSATRRGRRRLHGRGMLGRFHRLKGWTREARLRQPARALSGRISVMQEPTKLTATEAARLIRDGRLRPVELMEACLARIAEREPAVRAFAWFDAGCRAPRRGGGAAGTAARAADRGEGRAGYRGYAERIWLADLAWLAAAGGCRRGGLGPRSRRRGDRQDRHHRVRHAQAGPDRQPAQSASIRRAARAAGRRRAWRTGSFRSPSAPRPRAA